MATVDLKELGYRDEPFILAKDVTQVFYVHDMSSKPKKNKSRNKLWEVKEKLWESTMSQMKKNTTRLKI